MSLPTTLNYDRGLGQICYIKQIRVPCTAYPAHASFVSVRLSFPCCFQHWRKRSIFRLLVIP